MKEMIKRSIYLSIFMMIFTSVFSQLKDTLYVTSDDTTYAYAIVYIPVEETEQHTKVAKYAFDMGLTAVEIDYKRGKPSGRYKAYYPDGQLMEYGIYGWGSLHGDWTEYDEFGVIIIKGFYRNGLKVGKWSFRQEQIRGSYKNGLKHGKWKYYQGKQVIRTERYKRGVLIR